MSDLRNTNDTTDPHTTSDKNETKMITQINRPGTKILWQTEYDSQIEQPIIIVPYMGTISLEQDGDSILLMTEYVEEFIKTLRKVAKEQNEQE